MPWYRPNLSTLINRSAADIDANLTSSSPLLRRSNLSVIGKVLAATAHGLYGLIEFLAKQIIPTTAEGIFLRRHASLWLAVPEKAATYAIGQVVFTGTNGTVVPAGTGLIRADGIEYQTDADVTIVSGTAIADVTALTYGQIGNALAGVALNMASPIAGINALVLVHTTTISNGTDVEVEESIRSRLANRIQNPPHGGARGDYKTWALEVPGVTRAWEYPGEQGAGTLVLRFMRDDDLTPIPSPAEVAVVQDYIDERRCVTAKGVYVVAPIAVALDLTIAVTPNTADVQAAVQAELQDLISREAIPGGTLLLSHIREAISISAGENNYVMSVPSADVVSTIGNITTLGTITWV